MATVIVASLLDPILPFECLIQEVVLLIGIEDQVEWIERELRLMQSSLEGVEANRQRVEDEMKWAGEAREIFQKVENIIDVYLRKSAQYRRRGIFWKSVFFLNHLEDRFKLSWNKTKITAQIRDISKRRPKQPKGSYYYEERSSSSLGEPSTSREPQIPHETATVVASAIAKVNHVMSQNFLVHMGKTMAGNPHQRIEPHVFIKRQDIVSFYDDLRALAALLLTNNEHRSIISIVGMEGIGKTTLAELLYENIAVRQRFPCKAWVSVKSDCNFEALMRLIEEQVLVSLQEHRRNPIGLNEQDEELNTEEVPVLMLSAILEVNRYLIVLDGVSTAEIWDRLIKEFPSTLCGSRIVLTTRDVEVATHADPKSVHKLRLLSDDDSWALFTKTLTVPPELRERSRKMVMRCGGLPGAIIKLREKFQHTESTSSEWLRVLENPQLDPKPWKKTFDMINGSLPPYLERCLSYLRRFPVNFDIPLRRLIMLWIAERLVDERRADQDPPETVAGRCLAELIDRNMVQVTKKKAKWCS